MSEDALIVITSAIKTAFIDHPSSGHGTTWDQVTKSDKGGGASSGGEARRGDEGDQNSGFGDGKLSGYPDGLSEDGWSHHIYWRARPNWVKPAAPEVPLSSCPDRLVS
jgi:hypothetical protein